MNLQNTKIGFIGAGNMATALVQGLLANGVSKGNLLASDKSSEQLERLSSSTGIRVTDDNAEIVHESDAIVLAVKPQVAAEVLLPLKSSLASCSSLLVSIAAGISIASLENWSSSKQAIVRCMPNTPALTGAGASALFANSAVTNEQKQLAEAILDAVGVVSWLSREEELDAVTALSGSGPAYFFLLIEAMSNAAIKLGLDEDNARKLCVQTAFGAAKLAMESGVGVDELRRKVTSPGGTTEAALKQFEEDDFRLIVERALDKAAQRSKELSRDLSTSDTSGG